MIPAKNGIRRLSSIYLFSVVSTRVAIAAIMIARYMLFRISITMMKSVRNSAIIPSHARSGKFLSQCLPNLIPIIAAAMSPNVVIRITVEASGNSKNVNESIAAIAN